MLVKFEKNKLKADVLAIVENVIEKSYDEEEIRKLTLAEYVNMLVKTSTSVLNRLVVECDQFNIDKNLIEEMVKLEVEKMYK